MYNSHVAYINRRIDYHTKAKSRAKNKKTRDRHQKRIRHFERLLKQAEIMDMILPAA